MNFEALRDLSTARLEHLFPYVKEPCRAELLGVRHEFSVGVAGSPGTWKAEEQRFR